MTFVAGVMEIIDAALYDSVGLPRANPDADIPPVELFADPFGQVGRHPVSGRMEPKSEIETNLFLPKQLPAPHKFLVRAVRAAFIDVAGDLMPFATSSRFYRAAVLRLMVNSKPYLQLPLWKVLDPAVMFGDSRTFLDILKELSTTERADFIRALRWHVDPEVLIECEPCRFWCELRFDQTARWDSLTAPCGVVVLLEGQQARAVQ